MHTLIYALCGIIVIQQIIHHLERKDLYNRIMSKSLTEYKGDSPGYYVSAHRQVLKRWKQRGGGEDE
jgi:DNA-binding GntR family transcriptional regulator